MAIKCQLLFNNKLFNPWEGKRNNEKHAFRRETTANPWKNRKRKAAKNEQSPRAQSGVRGGYQLRRGKEGGTKNGKRAGKGNVRLKLILQCLV